MQEVRGSSPLISTMNKEGLQGVGNHGVVGLFFFQADVYHLFSARQIIQQIYRGFQVLMG